MAKTKSRFAIWAEYLAVRALTTFVGVLPEPLARWAGRALGIAVWTIKRNRRGRAHGNIERAMPGELTQEEIRRLVRESFIHLGLTIVETAWAARRLSREYFAERFTVEGAEPAEQVLADGRGAIAFTAHLGNWELFGGCMASRLGRLSALVHPPDNPLIEAMVQRMRDKMGIRALFTDRGVRPLARALKEGHPLAVLIDQHVKSSYTPTTFFGRYAATTAVVASLALRLDVPVFAAYSLRDGHTFRHHAHIEGPFELIRTGDHEADVRANTQVFNDRLEQIVRRHPEQWLWTRPRWRLAKWIEQGRAAEPGKDVA